MRLIYIKGETRTPITFSPNAVLDLSKNRKDLLLSFLENIFKFSTK